MSHNICSDVQQSIFSSRLFQKWLAKHISNKVSFKITIRKRHVYTDIRWPWIWNQYFYLGIWNDDRTKIILCLHFSSLHHSIHRTDMKLRLLMKSDILIFIWIFLFRIGMIEFSTKGNEIFLIISVPYAITELQVPETL